MWRRRGIEPPTLWLKTAAMTAMLDEVEDKAPSETGGMLLGYEAPGSGEIVIVDVIGPGPEAIHLHNRFEPDAHWQQQQLARIYEESGRVTTYLGDWHSHPEGAPAPSQEDRRTARRIARHKPGRARRPLIVIIGRGEDQDWVTRGFRYQRRQLKPLAPRSFS